MLTDPKLHSQVDALWDKLWAGGLPNPMDAIEQFSYLLFFKRLDDAENRREKQAIHRGQTYESHMPEEMRWRYWTKLQGAEALKHVRVKVFPWFKEMGEGGSSFERYMQNAEFKINRPALLIEACNAIDEMEISAQNQDVQGDLYEYLLSYLTTAGRAGQFRTPRHIIRMMVEMIDPKPNERIGDLAAGTCGFLVNAYEHILVQNTSKEILVYDEGGQPHNFIGDQLTDEQRGHLQKNALKGFDNDSGMTMLRIGSMNLMLHGIQSPKYFYMDTLSKDFTDERDYDVILMNPPFKGKVNKAEVSDTLPSNTTKSELLFVHLILRSLDMGGRSAVIVPDGVLFGSSRAHVELRKKIIEENRLDGVVSMPSGVFRPYAGVSTAVLLFTRGAQTENIWFYDMTYDGFSLDDKRNPTSQNDIPDILDCWLHRHDPAFQAVRQGYLEAFRSEVAPLKERHLRLQGEIHRLTFEQALAPDDEETNGSMDAVKEELAGLENQINPLHAQIDQLTRQFWVPKKQVKANKYDLSANRYRQVEHDEVFYEKTALTMERLLELDRVIAEEIHELERLVQS